VNKYIILKLINIMKFYFVLNVFLVVLYTTFVKSITNNVEKDGVKLKRDIETSTECKYISKLFSENESDNCCLNDAYVTCMNGHIVGL